MQSLSKVFLPGMKVLFDKVEKQSNIAVPDTETIGIADGIVSIDGKPVHSSFHENAYYWEREVGGKMETGCLLLKPLGQINRGFISRGNVVYNFTALPESKYTLNYSYTGKDGVVNVGFEFILGVEPHDKSYHTYGKFIYGTDVQGKPQVVASSSFADESTSLIYAGQCLAIIVDSTNQLQVKADLSALVSLPRSISTYIPDFQALYFDFTLIPDFQTITGSAKDDRLSSGVYVLSGSVELTRNVLQNSFARDDAKTAQFNENCRVSPLVSALRADADVPTATDLWLCPQPDMQKVSGDLSSLIFAVMLYHAADMNFHYTPTNTDINYAKWLEGTKDGAKSTICGLVGIQEDKVPDFINSLLVDAGTKAFLEDFAKAVISNAFRTSDPDHNDLIDAFGITKGPNAETVRETIEQICKYYFRGNYDTVSGDNAHPASMASNKYAIALQSKLTGILYAHKVEGFLKYYNSENPQNWANELYKKCIENITGISSKVFSNDQSSATQGAAGLKHLCMMLNCLDDSPQIQVEVNKSNIEANKLTYAQALYTHIYNLSATSLLDTLVIKEDEETECKDFIKDFIKEVLEDIYSGSEKITESALQAIGLQVADFKKKYGEGLDLIISAQMNEVTAFMLKMSTTFSIAQCFPRAPFGGAIADEICPIAIYAYALYKAYGTFKNPDAYWTDRATAVTACIRVFFGVGCDILRLSAIKTLTSTTADLNAKMDAIMRLKFGGKEMSTIKDIARFGNEGEEIEIPDSIIESARYKISPEAVEYVSKTTKFFRGADIFLRGANVALFAFAAVSLGIKIKHDFDTGQPGITKWFDIMQEICVSGAALSEAVSLGLDMFDIVCDGIPLVGNVLMVAGLLLSALEAIFVGTPPVPEAPDITFTKEVLSPFVKALPLPSLDWLNNANTSN
jgi:hypothetical protein